MNRVDEEETTVGATRIAGLAAALAVGCAARNTGLEEPVEEDLPDRADADLLEDPFESRFEEWDANGDSFIDLYEARWTGLPTQPE